MEFRPTLFWDVNPDKLDYEKNAQFIIGRVLDLGNLDDWKIIKARYGLERLRQVAGKHIFSDPRSANFWAITLNIPGEKLKCTQNPSLQTPKAFLSR